jgi:hypothetical protein
MHAPWLLLMMDGCMVEAAALYRIHPLAGTSIAHLHPPWFLLSATAPLRTPLSLVAVGGGKHLN